jgi:hypothetical protein
MEMDTIGLMANEDSTSEVIIGWLSVIKKDGYCWTNEDSSK